MSGTSASASEIPVTPSSILDSAPKLRSCAVCRTRKVRCDKQSPCSNCRRARIACVLPSTDRPPRWARRLAHSTGVSNTPATTDAGPNVAKVIDRLRTLENLVQELSGQLEEAQAAARSGSSGSPEVGSSQNPTKVLDSENQRDSSLATSTGRAQNHFGRLVHQDATRSRYVSSGFWSRVNDELDGLKMDTLALEGDEFDSSDTEASPPKVETEPSHELERTPSERHAFLFRHNLSPSPNDLHQFHPLPSQIPFFLDVFSENVNFVMQIVHMPTVTKMVRDWRGSGMTPLTPSNEVLMFSIYYAAITSMDEDEVMTNFGSSKRDLNLKYRLGLEHALAKADFLNSPDIILVQGFAIFLSLGRRHDSPRFVWMMTGLLIRMAQYLGLQRDGVQFKHLTPYEIEMRRKVWWAVYMLDLRASEDQGTDPTITSGSFDTRIPLNIDEEDIGPDSKETPIERDGITQMSFARINYTVGVLVRQMMVPSATYGAAGLEEQNRLLHEMYQKFEHGYFSYETDTEDIAYWVAVTIARLVMAKMTLIVHLPVLFSSSSEHWADETRTKLLVSAIEVAEYNHALNAERAARKWRWVYQTYTHWHAIVYLLIEISRRSWSPIVERAWVALHSSWLIPAHNSSDKNLRIWVPLRKLMVKARKHRDVELARLRADSQAAARLEMEEQNISLPSSPESFGSGYMVDDFCERWRQLVRPTNFSQTFTTCSEGPASLALNNAHILHPTPSSVCASSYGDLGSNTPLRSIYLGTSEQQTGPYLGGANASDTATGAITAPNDSHLRPAAGRPSNSVPTISTPEWSDGRFMGLGSVPWLWADVDPSVDLSSNVNVGSADMNLDLDNEIDWYNWVESAKSMEFDAGIGSNIQM